MSKQLNALFPVVEADGKMTRQFREWANDVADSLPLTGSGSPEGVVEAPQFSFYIDESGSAGSILYIKISASIAGDRSQGWLGV